LETAPKKGKTYDFALCREMNDGKVKFYGLGDFRRAEPWEDAVLNIFADFRALRLSLHPFDPLSAPCGSGKQICKVLCFPCNLVVPELHDAHGVGRLAIICQDEFGDPKITIANDSSDSKLLLARLTTALLLYVVSPAGSLA
jgi:hypothetical protein